MKKRKIALISLGAGAILLVVALLLGSALQSRGAGLLIESDTPAQIYINGEMSGRSPLKRDLKPGEVTVKIVPDALDKPYMPYETKVDLEAGIQTVVRRVLGETPQTSAGEVVSFTKIGGRETSIAVVSTPDGAVVKLNGEIKGNTPLTISGIVPGNNQLNVSANGFATRDFTIKTYAGYRLTSIVNLATAPLAESTPAPAASESPQPEAKKEETKIVEILTTPTGFLRVREKPTTSSTEVARVNPGKTFPLLDDKTKGWFKIAYEEGKEGWVSDEFATVSATPKTN